MAVQLFRRASVRSVVGSVSCSAGLVQEMLRKILVLFHFRPKVSLVRVPGFFFFFFEELSSPEFSLLP